jgi:hypothetical protein
MQSKGRCAFCLDMDLIPPSRSLPSLRHLVWSDCGFDGRDEGAACTRGGQAVSMDLVIVGRARMEERREMTH